MRRWVLLVGAVMVVASVVAGAVAARPSGSVALPVRGLLVVEHGQPSPRVAIVTLAGKRLSVPARVRESPLGLSPDARLVAAVGADGVLIGPVRGGSMQAVLRGDCSSPPCPYGVDPSYAWSPDSQRLAAAANPLRGPTSLKLFAGDGQVVRSFTLPNGNPEKGTRVYHHLIAWSPGGSRLLLLQTNDYGPTAVVVLDIETGRARTLARLGFCDDPSLAWSPDGRMVALTSEGRQDCRDRFEVIEAASARAVVRCSDTAGCKGGTAWAPGGTVWAPDSRSLFGAVFSKGSSRIDRFYLTGRRTNVIKPTAGWLVPDVALATGLVYHTSPPRGNGVLYLHHFATGHRDMLISPQSSIESVLPLSRMP